MSAIVAPALADLEAVIERGLRTFVEVGQALLEIRDRRLYREVGYTEFDAYCKQRWGWSETYATRNIQAAQVVQALPNGNGPANEAQARELVPLLREDEAAIEEVWRELKERHGDAVTAEKVREAVSVQLRRDQMLGVRFSSSDPEWYTPSLYVEAARRVLGGIDLDPASSELANRTVRAERYFTIKDDGLLHPWPGHIWLNPPYAGSGPAFTRYLLEQYEAGTTTAAIVLLPAYNCDTAWFRPLWDHTLCFHYGRIQFTTPTEDDRKSNSFASVFVYLGPEPDAFEREFSPFGAVVERRKP